MTRREELLGFLGEGRKSAEADQLVDEVVFLEDQLRKLKKLPFLRVNPKDPEQQKATPAAKQYKEFTQQYINSLKLLLKIAGDIGESEETSPLREWIKKKNEEMDA